MYSKFPQIYEVDFINISDMAVIRWILLTLVIWLLSEVMWGYKRFTRNKHDLHNMHVSKACKCVIDNIIPIA